MRSIFTSLPQLRFTRRRRRHRHRHRHRRCALTPSHRLPTHVFLYLLVLLHLAQKLNELPVARGGLKSVSYTDLFLLRYRSDKVSSNVLTLGSRTRCLISGNIHAKRPRCLEVEGEDGLLLSLERVAVKLVYLIVDCGDMQRKVSIALVLFEFSLDLGLLSNQLPKVQIDYKRNKKARQKVLQEFSANSANDHRNSPVGEECFNGNDGY
ncbi:hypothetical protein AKJ16_DCAP22700 [Drosera capensis]